MLFDDRKPSSPAAEETASAGTVLPSMDLGLLQRRVDRSRWEDDATVDEHALEASASDSGVLPAGTANLARLVVLVLTVVWATNFPVIKGIFQTGLQPPEYAGLRFGIAALSLLPLAKWDNKELIKGGAQCGAWVATGYVTQAIALTTASANKGAFICASQVIFVAVVSCIFKHKFVPRTILAAVLALAGVGLLELAGPVAPEWSDLWCLGMPVCFGMGYIRLEELMEEYPDDALTVSALKVGVVGAVALVWAAGRAALGGGVDELVGLLASPNMPWMALLYTGLVTTAGAIVAESYAFKYVPAADAAVILSTEPLWAALVAWQFLGEELSPTDWAGGALIIGACLLNELAKPNEVVESDAKDS